jgi:hypothetical protein
VLRGTAATPKMGNPVKIINLTPPQGGNELARASIEVADGIRLHDVKITRTGCVFARNATFSSEAVKQISDLVKGARHHAIAS